MVAAVAAVLIMAQVVVVEAPVVARIGAIDAPAQEVFGRIADLAVDSEDRIYVLDAQASEVRVFTTQGQHVTTFGSEGDGPGEFRQPFAISVSPHGVVVIGRNASRFSKEGEHIESLRFPLGVKAASQIGEGVYLVHTGVSASFRETNPIETFLVQREHTITDSVMSAPSSSVAFRTPTAVGVYTSPFCAAFHFAARPDGTVAVADGRTGELIILDITSGGISRPRRAARVAAPARPMSEADFKRILDRLPAQLGVVREQIQVAEIRSNICGLASAPDGRLWVRAEDEDERQVWTAFDGSSLDPIREVHFPEGVAVEGFGADLAIGIWKAALEVQYVVVLEAR